VAPPGPLVYDIVFPINSSPLVLRPEEGDIGTVTVRLEVPALDNFAWAEIEEIARPYAHRRIVTMVAPGGGIGRGKVSGVLTGTEHRPRLAREISEHKGAFVWEVSVQRHKGES
jgi:hypothetical protein